MKSIVADIIGRVRLYTPEEGGRCSVIPPVQFGCPFFFEGEGFDCRLLLDQVGSALAPGSRAEVPIKFLYPEYIKPRLRPGQHFQLWDLKTFAEGEILEVLSSEEGLDRRS